MNPHLVHRDAPPLAHDERRAGLELAVVVDAAPARALLRLGSDRKVTLERPVDKRYKSARHTQSSDKSATTDPRIAAEHDVVAAAVGQVAPPEALVTLDVFLHPVRPAPLASASAALALAF